MIGTIFAQAPTGLVDGGWGYVGAAYAATWLCFAGYALSLVLRARAVHDDQREES